MANVHKPRATFVSVRNRRPEFCAESFAENQKADRKFGATFFGRDAAKSCRHWGVRLLFHCCVLFGMSSLAYGVCLTPPGNIGGDPVANIVDVQCSILMNLWSLGGQVTPVPSCITTPGSPAIIADHNCDGVINVGDTLLAINFALDIELDAIIDGNGNQCVDACEADSDGDGTTDLLDCAPLNPDISASSAELCNGWDDNCNGVIDEAVMPSVAASCSDDTVCTGIETCGALLPNLGIVITELLVQPTKVPEAVGEWFEIYNGGATAVNIAGWSISNALGQTHVIVPGGSLFVPPSGYLVLGANANFSQNGGARVAYAYLGLTLDNGGGSVVLKNKDGVEMDRVDYGAAKGMPTVAGASFALIRPDLNNNVASSWTVSTVAFGAGDLGTPWSPNVDVMPSFCEAGTPLDCVDGNGCTDDSCDPVAGCVFVDNTDPCDDANVCTTADGCIDGVCTGGPALVCDDDNGCTDDSCDPATGCVYVNNTAACDDGTACTNGDVCVDGGCVSGPLLDCDDNNPCTDDSCDVALGCVHSNNALACDDGSACTTADVCALGDCVGGPAPNCDDNNGCTDDSCDPATGCVYVNNTAACDDGTACTNGDVCADGGCVSGSPLDCNDNNPCTDDSCDEALGCIHPANTLPCDDGNACTTADACALGDCVGGPAPECDDDNGCTDDSCDPATGCVYVNNTAACDDGNACTAADSCAAGECQSGVPINCNDGDECTADSCLPESGCLFVPAPGCELEGNTICLISGPAGTKVVCPLKLSRATMAMPPATSVQFRLNWDASAIAALGLTDMVCTGPGGTPPCSSVPVPPATLDPTGHSVFPIPQDFSAANGGSTVFVLPLSEPNTPITTAYQFVGAPVGNPEFLALEIESLVDIPSGAPLAVEVFDIVGATATVLPMVGTMDNGVMVMELVDCSVDPLVCEDGSICTADGCDPATHQCVWTDALSCNDGDMCNGIETCDPAMGCQLGAAPDCDDGVGCTQDGCDPATGCEHIAADTDCDDGKACTLDVCDPALGCQHPVDVSLCDDTISCTEESCDANGHCVHTAIDSVCDDGAACTTDVCDAQLGCQYSGDDTVCEDDDNPCTTAACVPVQGCTQTTVADCLPAPALCALSGAQGQEVSCAIRVARATVGTPLPAALQFHLLYDAALFGPTAFEDTICTGPGGTAPCAAANVPPAVLFPSGHTVAALPSVSEWNGSGHVVAYHPGEPTSVLNEAYLQAQAIVGEPTIVILKGNLLADVPAATPILIQAANIIGATPQVGPLYGQVQNGIIVLSVPDCTAMPAACEDGDPCTIDGCVDGICQYQQQSCGDGDACNGMESCLPLVGCQLAAPPQCEDGQDCTTDGCDPALGCVYAADLTPCEDGIACTIDFCLPFEGCVHTPDATPCNDGNFCTVDQCDLDLGCTHTPDDAACEDGQSCSTAVCDIAAGCVFETDDAACADDGDPCTAALCVVGLGCTHVPTETCPVSTAVCLLSGNSGDTVMCTLRLARATQLTPSPASLQVTLQYDDTKAQPTGLADLVCPDPMGPCMVQSIPPGALWPSGHAVTPAPFSFATWAGQGALFFYNAADPAAHLTDAWQNGEGFVDDTQLVELAFLLLEDIDPLAPVVVDAASIVASTAAVETMGGTVESGVMVVSLLDCTTVEDICDDGDACTTQTCDPITKGCVYQAVQCSDGDACNGVEQCVFWKGCVQAPPLVCDDGIACTTELCDPAIGCVFTPVDLDCDDSVACTDDICDPLAGCIHVAVDAGCDDGVSCTVDTCVLGLGCQSVGDDSFCEDGASCTTDTCDLALGCQAVFDDAGCDDANPCTIDACTAVTDCTHTLIQSMECLPPGALCALSGGAGQVVTCPLRLARANSVIPGAAALQIALSYDATALTIDGLIDSLCFGPGGPCMDVAVPPAMLSPTGHQVALAPNSPALWNGQGTVFVFNPADPTVTITEAAVDGGAIVGETLFAELVITLQHAISAESPAVVWPDQIVGSTSMVTPLYGSVVTGVILTGVAGCAGDGDCDDGNACTLDSCSMGTCTFQPGPDCSDGDPCNGVESCDPWTGACVSGDPPDCDDGQTCTTDGCDASGCFHAPVLTPLCLPDGALCGATGSAGTVVTCELHVVRAMASVPPAAALEIAFQTEGSSLKVTKFLDTICMGEGGQPPCMDAETPPNLLFPTSHSVILVPEDIAAWSEGGSAFLFNMNDPTVVLTDALAGAGATAESMVMKIEVTLQQDIGTTNPAYLWATDVVGATVDVQELIGQVIQGMVVLSFQP